MNDPHVSARTGGSRRAVLFAATLAWLAVSGCSGFRPQPGPGEEPGGRFLTLTEPIIAIGDTQEHEATSVPMLDNDNALDRYLEVTQRPPEQPLFGRRIMEWVFEAHRDSAFLHLGDVLDLSCKSEAKRMRRLFDAGPARGALLPGNHDGLMFGIYGYDVLSATFDTGATKWNDACRPGRADGDVRRMSEREAFTKRDFISTYLAGLGAGPAALAGLPAPGAIGDQRISWTNPSASDYISAIEARLVDGNQYANSFVAQRLRLPPAPGATRGVVVIALDTNQTGQLASTWDVLRGNSPGSVGHIRPEQVRAVSRWVGAAARDGDIVVFAGHHNWQSLGLPSRVMLRELMSTLPHPLVYLSAHTHRGFWAVHRALDNRPLLELNTSSLSDWPIAYRRISFAYDETANRLMVRGDLMPAGDRPHGSDADLLAAWERQACTASGFDAAALRQLDAELVARQHASRGSLFGLLRAKISPDCEDCEADRYRRANEYQDEMLEVLIETGRQLSADAHRLDAVALPAFCRGAPWSDCAAALVAERPADTRGLVDLFVRKTRLVDLLGGHLDDLDEPRAKAYMTCRAVLAAKIDFDGSSDDANSHRGEAKRRSEQFFRVEASVGME
ncbi:MAG: hypothetical protein RJA99_1002 [Pseudomonadota bacterium]|jgi:hypothetical protein